ncbi:MAG: hypothetical protein IPK96_11905 [Flammeovirgaceae bacterium]|nr:hypothetical protein [Flammeovirgaceae bacterium]
MRHGSTFRASIDLIREINCDPHTVAFAYVLHHELSNQHEESWIIRAHEIKHA